MINKLLKKIIDYKNPKTIFIDEDKNLKFYLTSSSKKKTKKSNANLLAGIVFVYKMFLLCTADSSFSF